MTAHNIEYLKIRAVIDRAYSKAPEYSNIAAETTRRYDPIDMNASWKRFGLVLVVAILTIASVATLVHRHAGNEDPGCVLCHVRYERAVGNPVTISLPVPVPIERSPEIIPDRLLTRELIFDRLGRAPPATSFAS